MTLDPIIATVRDYIAREFLQPDDRDSLTASTPLVTGGILDSLASLNLVGFLEKQFGIKIQPHEVNVDNLDTLTAIAALVKAKRGA
jgi:acyl carrier protein